MSTAYDNLDAGLAKVRPFATLPTVYEFYGEGLGQEADQPEWKGGELVLYTTLNRIYIQINTSGTTAAWRSLSATFATTTSTSSSTSTSTTTTSSTTTSSSTSTSTTTSSSTSSSTTSSTSTSTSSSSSTSTSTSTSSTTTP